MTDQAMLDILRRGKEVKIASLSPHDFCRTFASNMIDIGVDIIMVQNLMGHASLETMARYVKRGEAALAIGGVSKFHNRCGRSRILKDYYVSVIC